MSTRLRIELPETFPFATRIPVRVDDINAGGHLANDAVLSLAHEARMRWVRSLGFESELNVGGMGLIMTSAEIVYRAEGTYGMDLKVEVAPADVRAASFAVLYRLSDDASALEIARVRTVLAFFDYKERSLARAPEAFLRAVKAPDDPA